MLGVTPESIDTLFEPIVKFAKGGNNTLTVDAVAAIKHDPFANFTIGSNKVSILSGVTPSIAVRQSSKYL